MSNFPSFTRWSCTATKKTPVRCPHLGELGKRKSLADVPDEALAVYLEQYYEGLKKNKSNAEMRWLQSVKAFLNSEVKHGRDIRRLQNEANFSKFEMPLELKIAIELENKVQAS
jgi:hypothetical protein